MANIKFTDKKPWELLPVFQKNSFAPHKNGKVGDQDENNEYELCVNESANINKKRKSTLLNKNCV